MVICAMRARDDSAPVTPCSRICRVGVDSRRSSRFIRKPSLPSGSEVSCATAAIATSASRPRIAASRLKTPVRCRCRAPRSRPRRAGDRRRDVGAKHADAGVEAHAGAGADPEVRLAGQRAVLGDEAGVDEADAAPALGEAVAQLGRGLEQPASADHDLLALELEVVDADRLVGVAAHRAAAAGEEQEVGRAFLGRGAAVAADQRPPGQGEPVLGAEAQVAAALERAARRDVAELELVERLEGRGDIVAARGVERIVAPVVGAAAEQRQDGEVAGAEVVLVARPRRLHQQAAGQPAAELLGEAEARLDAALPVGLVLEAERRGAGDEVGVRRPHPRLGEGDADLVAEVVEVDRADAVDARREPQPLGAAEQVAVLPEGRDADPVDRRVGAAGADAARPAVLDPDGDRQAGRPARSPRPPRSAASGTPRAGSAGRGRRRGRPGRTARPRAGRP